MTPFITPTNGPWWPKSVVMVTTPLGRAHARAGEFNRGRRVRGHPGAPRRRCGSDPCRALPRAAPARCPRHSPRSSRSARRPGAAAPPPTCCSSVCADCEIAPSTSSFSRWVTCSAKSADSGSASCRRSALASVARWRSSSRRLSSRSRIASVSTFFPPRRPLACQLTGGPPRFASSHCCSLSKGSMNFATPSFRAVRRPHPDQRPAVPDPRARRSLRQCAARAAAPDDPRRR